jgi:nucleoid DNA-binding protein
MIPKKYNSIYKDVSEDLNISENLLEDIVEFYYKELRTNLTQLKHPRINVEGLGQFVARANVVRKAIPKYNKMLENHDTSTFSAYYNKKMLEEKVTALQSLEKQLNDADIKKTEFKKKKYENNTKNNLEG